VLPIVIDSWLSIEPKEKFNQSFYDKLNKLAFLLQFYRSHIFCRRRTTWIMMMTMMLVVVVVMLLTRNGSTNKHIVMHMMQQQQQQK
jgi:uncharacterized membrane-anchored protein